VNWAESTPAAQPTSEKTDCARESRYSTALSKASNSAMRFSPCSSSEVWSSRSKVRGGRNFSFFKALQQQTDQLQLPGRASHQQPLTRRRRQAPLIKNQFAKNYCPKKTTRDSTTAPAPTIDRDTRQRRPAAEGRQAALGEESAPPDAPPQDLHRLVVDGVRMSSPSSAMSSRRFRRCRAASHHAACLAFTMSGGAGQAPLG